MYSVQDFGARGDGQHLETAALQAAIDRCAAEGGGTVVLPPGVYRSGTLWLRDNVELHLTAGARLQGSTDRADYQSFTAPGFHHERAPEKTTLTLLCATDAHHIAVTGPGEINGGGAAFYDPTPTAGGFYSKPAEPRPRMVLFFRCTDVRFEDTSFIDSPCWTFWLVDCRRVNIHRLRVLGDQKMINNDGIDLDACRDVTVSDCFIQTGDDCLILRAIPDMIDTPAICENVTVTNCTLNSRCQGIRVGCPSDHLIRNCTFANVTFQGTGNGIHLENPQRYLAPGNSGRLDLSNLLFSHFLIDTQKCPIRIQVDPGVRLVHLGGITFSDFRIRSVLPITFIGSAETVIEDVVLSNIQIATSGDDAVVCRQCRNLQFNQVVLTNLNGVVK